MPAERGPPNAEESRKAAARGRAAKIGAAKACARKRTTPQRDGGGRRVSSKRGADQSAGHAHEQVDYADGAVRVARKAKSPETFSFDEQALGGYDNGSTETMEGDGVRTEFYRNGLRHGNVRGLVGLDIGTGDSAFLTRLALDEGAKHMYAIEIRPKAARQAAAILEEQYPGKATVLQCNARKLKRRDATKLRGDAAKLLAVLSSIDFVVHEVFGTISSEEGIVHIVLNLYESGLSAEARFIPNTAGTLLCPVTRPRFDGTRSALNATPVLWQGYTDEGALTRAQLAPSELVEEVHFEYPRAMARASQEHTRVFTTTRGGEWNSMCLQLWLACGWPANGDLTLISGGEGTNWEEIYVDLPTPVYLPPQCTIEVTMKTAYESTEDHAYCIWTISYKVRELAFEGSATLTSADIRAIQC